MSRRQRLLATASFLGRENKFRLPKKMLAYVGIGRGPLFRILSALPFFFWRHVTAATRRKGTVKVRRREGGRFVSWSPTSRRHVVPGFRPILAATRKKKKKKTSCKRRHHGRKKKGRDSPTPEGGTFQTKAPSLQW